MSSLILNLALQGGGAHGAFTWGVLDRLLEEELVVMGASGASAGALNAAALVSGLLTGGREGARDTLERLWRRISALAPMHLPLGPLGDLTMGTMSLATHLFSPYDLNPIGLSPLGAALPDIIDFPRLRAAQRPLVVVAATNARSGASRLFTNAELSPEALMASTCLPQLFRAVEIDGESYWDGGFTANPPIVPLAEVSLGATILLVRITPLETSDVPHTAAGIRSRVAELAFAQPLERELAELERLKRLSRPPLNWLSGELRRIDQLRVETISGESVLRALDPATRFIPDWPLVEKLRDAGRTAADCWLDSYVRAAAEEP